MEVRKILLRYHKRCFICLNQGYISQNFLKKNGCYSHNSAICNTIDEETPENTNVKFYSSEKDFILLQTTDANLFNKSN